MTALSTGEQMKIKRPEGTEQCGGWVPQTDGTRCRKQYAHVGRCAANTRLARRPRKTDKNKRGVK